MQKNLYPDYRAEAVSGREKTGVTFAKPVLTEIHAGEVHTSDIFRCEIQYFLR